MTAPAWRDVACPKCGAPAGQQCFSSTGKSTKDTHADRFKVAREAGMPTPLLGFPPQREQPHVVSVADRTRAICGAVIDTIPELQPPLASADPKCRNLLRRVPYTHSPVHTGVCPMCGAEETLDGGLIPAHHQLVVSKGGIRRSSENCLGKGHPPEVAS